MRNIIILNESFSKERITEICDFLQDWMKLKLDEYWLKKSNMFRPSASGKSIYFEETDIVGGANCDYTLEYSRLASYCLKRLKSFCADDNLKLSEEKIDSFEQELLQQNELSKEQWIESTLKQFKGCRKDVITFIADIASCSSNEGDARVIETLFSCGYCYYFALMLKDAFGGEICWHKNHSHIVWRDGSTDMDICYDIHGVFDDYEANEIVPITMLGDMLEVFRHRGKDDTVKTHKIL